MARIVLCRLHATSKIRDKAFLSIWTKSKFNRMNGTFATQSRINNNDVRFGWPCYHFRMNTLSGCKPQALSPPIGYERVSRRKPQGKSVQKSPQLIDWLKENFARKSCREQHVGIWCGNCFLFLLLLVFSALLKRNAISEERINWSKQQLKLF